MVAIAVLLVVLGVIGWWFVRTRKALQHLERFAGALDAKVDRERKAIHGTRNGVAFELRYFKESARGGGHQLRTSITVALASSQAFALFARRRPSTAPFDPAARPRWEVRTDDVEFDRMLEITAAPVEVARALFTGRDAKIAVCRDIDATIETAGSQLIWISNTWMRDVEHATELVGMMTTMPRWINAAFDGAGSADAPQAVAELERAKGKELRGQLSATRWSSSPGL